MNKVETPFIVPDCRFFNGYKPCVSGQTCSNECVNRIPRGSTVLVISLEAFGAVLQSTALLPAFKRKHPASHLSWLTMPSAIPILLNNPYYIDELIPYNWEQLQYLTSRKFDFVYNADKSRKGASLTAALHAENKFGFSLNENGVIVPCGEEASYQYRLGIDDDLKFRRNTLSGQEIVSKTFDLFYQRDEYQFYFTEEELGWRSKFMEESGLVEGDRIIGFNTGCSELYPNKKFTLDQSISLCRSLVRNPNVKILLLGGPEDIVRNAEIKRSVPDVINTPCDGGIRRGMMYMSIPQTVISGDSFGLHMAIALKKYCIAWFGVSCAVEIDLYERGKKFTPEGLACSPCWKKKCPYSVECRSLIDLDAIAEKAIAQALK